MTQLAEVGQSFVRAAMRAPFLEREQEHGLAVPLVVFLGVVVFFLLDRVFHGV